MLPRSRPPEAAADFILRRPADVASRLRHDFFQILAIVGLLAVNIRYRAFPASTRPRCRIPAIRQMVVSNRSFPLPCPGSSPRAALLVVVADLLLTQPLYCHRTTTPAGRI